MTWSSSSPATAANADTPDATDTTETRAAADWDWVEFDTSGRLMDKGQDEARARQHQEEVEEAYRRGLSDGQAAAATAARNELQHAMSATLEALQEVRANRDAWAATLEENLVVLAAAMARQIVDRALEMDASILPGIARRAMAVFPLDEPVRIRLHPADLEKLYEGEVAAVDDLIGERTVRWVPDEDMVHGGCIVEGPDKIVDGRVEEALARLVRTLSDA